MNTILEKRKLMLSKRTDLLKSMHIESALDNIKPQKKEKRKRKPVVIDENLKRKSRRILGLAPEIITPKSQSSQIDEEPSAPSISFPKSTNNSYSHIDLTGMEEPIHANGYTGWIDPEVCKRHNLPLSEEDLQNTTQSKKIRNESGAKEYSKKCLRTNPNTYFYRHVEPNETQWTGEWQIDEIRAFYNTAKQFGCGDKWGLFSTYVPHRVGYQCSNFYRQFFIPRGIIVDPNYTVTPDGVAVYKSK